MTKKLMVFLAVFFCVFFGGTSYADVNDGQGYRILPWCPAQGPVYLTQSGTTVQGFVGMDVITLTNVEGHIVGTFKNEPVDLDVFRNDSVRGHIGGYPVNWTIGKNGVIYGLQPCGFIPLDGGELTE